MLPEMLPFGLLTSMLACGERDGSANLKTPTMDASATFEIGGALFKLTDASVDAARDVASSSQTLPPPYDARGAPGDVASSASDWTAARSSLASAAPPYDAADDGEETLYWEVDEETVYWEASAGPDSPRAAPAPRAAAEVPAAEAMKAKAAEAEAAATAAATARANAEAAEAEAAATARAKAEAAAAEARATAAATAAVDAATNAATTAAATAADASTATSHRRVRVRMFVPTRGRRHSGSQAPGARAASSAARASDAAASHHASLAA